jgi:hypothetical protein
MKVDNSESFFISSDDHEPSQEGRGMDAWTLRRCNWRGTTTPPEKRSNRCDNSAGTTMQSTCTQQQLETNKQTKVSWAPNFRVILQWKGTKFELGEVPWEP